MSDERNTGVDVVSVIIIVFIILFCTGYFDKPKEAPAPPPTTAKAEKE